MLSRGERHWIQTGEKIEGGKPTKMHEIDLKNRIKRKVEEAVGDLVFIRNSGVMPNVVEDATRTLFVLSRKEKQMGVEEALDFDGVD